jgi:hypothetical protein
VEGKKEGRGGGEGNDDMICHHLPPSVGLEGTREGRPNLSPLPLFLLLRRICFFSFFVVEQSGGSLNLGSEVTPTKRQKVRRRSHSPNVYLGLPHSK